MKWFATILAVIVIVMAYFIFRNVQTIPSQCRMGIRLYHKLTKAESKQFPHHMYDDKWLAAHHIPTSKIFAQLNDHFQDPVWMKAHGMYLVPCPKTIYTAGPAAAK